MIILILGQLIPDHSCERSIGGGVVKSEKYVVYAWLLVCKHMCMGWGVVKGGDSINC